jgi:hypothetical protein
MKHTDGKFHIIYKLVRQVNYFLGVLVNKIHQFGLIAWLMDKGEKMITQQEVLDIFFYNPETGELFRKHQNGKTKIVKTNHNKRYTEIGVNKKLYLVHRLIFLYMTGETPIEVDHINHKRDDNRWCNLRNCTHSQNAKNGSLHKNNKSGHKGVCWSKGMNKWMAYITVDYKMKMIGYYDTVEEAGNAYDTKAAELFGKFQSP